MPQGSDVCFGNGKGGAKETLIYSSIVIPAKAGIQKKQRTGPGLRRGDE
jgi:hypothetical protein